MVMRVPETENLNFNTSILKASLAILRAGKHPDMDCPEKHSLPNRFRTIWQSLCFYHDQRFIGPLDWHGVFTPTYSNDTACIVSVFFAFVLEFALSDIIPFLWQCVKVMDTECCRTVGSVGKFFLNSFDMLESFDPLDTLQRAVRTLSGKSKP